MKACTYKITKNVSELLMFLSLLLLTLLHTGKSDDPNFVGYICPRNGYTYSVGSSFQENLNDTLFTRFVANASQTRLSTFTNGTGIDQLYALYYCRGDISLQTCHDCVLSGSRKLVEMCNLLKQGLVYYKQCTLRYANYSIFSFDDDDLRLYYPADNNTSVYSEYLNQYRPRFDSEMRSLVDQAANNTNRFAKGEVNLSSSQTLQGVAQCAPVISGASCQRCLTAALQQLTLWANNMMFLPTCFIGFEIYGLPPSPPPSPSSSFPARYKILIALLSTAVALLLLAGFFYCKKQHTSQGDPHPSSDEERNDQLSQLNEYDESVELDLNNRRRLHGLIRFTYYQVEDITSGFSRKIGEGGYAEVYHGRLSEDNSEVAVKVFSKNDAPKQFSTEIEVLGRIYHKNLVSLIGYCEEGTNLALIYEYMAKGDLKSLLAEHPDAISWKKRVEIATDTAQGLDYLHHGCSPPIVHRDVKTANILLSEHFRAKVADFGFSKIFPAEYVSNLQTRVIGTVGYLDPQYNLTGQLNEKGDVYSFGIVLLELVTGKQPILKKDMNLGQWVRKMVERGDIRSILDPRLRQAIAEVDENYTTVWKTVELAVRCVELDIAKRPRMSLVVAELKECLTLINASTSASPQTSMEIKSAAGSSSTMSPTPR